MAHSVHLYRKNETYYFRCRFPADLKQWFDRDELKRSLRTKSLTAARRMVKLLSGRTEELFFMMRSGMLTNSQIKQLVDDYIKFALNKSDTDRLEHGVQTETIETDEGPVEMSQRVQISETDTIRSELVDNAFDYVAKRLDEFLSETQINIDKDSTQYLQVCRDIALAHVNVIHQIDCQRDMGDFSDPYYLTGSNNLQTQQPVTPTEATQVQPQTTKPKHLLAAVITRFIEDQKREGKASETSIDEYEGTCSRFTWILGDREISSFTKDDMRQFVDVVKRLPKNYRKNPLYRDKTLKAVLAMKPTQIIAASTVNKHIRLLKAVFTWAENEDWITSNPTKVINYVSERRGKAKPRVRFTHEDLKKMTDSLHDEAQAGRLKGRPERFWIPLIAVFSGMRINEICQLQTTDIQQESDIWFFNVDETEGVTTVKTEAGIRQVPIHPTLLDLGFIDYFNKVKAAGETQVWPKLQKTRKGYSRAVGYWFNGDKTRPGFNRKYVTEDQRKSFHSTRHAFRDELKQLRIDNDVAAEIVGHEYEEGEAGTYTDSFLLQIKLEALQQVNYGLDLSHLKPLSDNYISEK